MDQRHWCIYLILKKQTDYIPAQEILDILLEEYGIHCEIKAIYASIRALNQSFKMLFNIDEMIESKKKKGYRIVHPVLNKGQIRFLHDSLTKSNSVSAKEGNEIFNALTPLFLDMNMNQLDEVKDDDGNILFQLDTILNAIEAKKCISFEYIDYTFDKFNRIIEEPSNRGNSKQSKYLYIVSPYAVMMKDGKYYLSSYNDKHKDLRTYRLDRMRKVQMIKSLHYAYNDSYDIKNTVNKSVNMYLGEESIRLELKADKKNMRSIFDMFKDRIYLEPTHDPNKLRVIVDDVILSEGLIGWIMMMSPSVEVLGPVVLKDKMRALVKATMQLYNY